MDRPNLKSAVTGEQACKTCGHIYELPESEKREMLAEGIEQLEHSVSSLQSVLIEVFEAYERMSSNAHDLAKWRELIQRLKEPK